MAAYHIWLIGISLVANGLSHHEANAEICDTSVCHEAAAEIISSMNISADPCGNFYEYACGNWESNHPPPDYFIGGWNSDESFKTHILSLLRDELLAEPSAEDIRPIQHVKEMYKSCMDEKARTSVGFEPILAKIREVHGWPMLMKKGTWNKDTITWQEIAQYYFNLTGSHPLFNLAQWPISEGEDPQLEISGFFSVDMKDESEVSSLINSSARVIANVMKSQLSDEDLQKDIDDLVNFMSAIFKPISTWGEANFRSVRVNLSVESLNDFLPSNVSRAQIDLGGILGATISRVANLTSSRFSTLSIFHQLYFKNLVKVLELTDERTIVNFVHFTYLSNVLPYSSIEDPFLPANRITFNFRNTRPRWVECMQELKESSPITHRLLMRKYFPNNLKATIDPFFTNIKNSIGATGPDSTWLSAEMKEKLNKPIDNVTISSKYPDWFDNDTAIIDYYKELKMYNTFIETMWNWKSTSVDNLIKNVATLRYEEEAYKTIDISNERILGGSVDYEVVVIPALAVGNFLPLRFHKSLPEYVNYGTAGSRFAGTAGNILENLPIIDDNFILNDTLTRFDELGDCLLQAQDVDIPGVAISFLYRKRHLIGEYVGVTTAFYAYKELKKQKYPNGEFKLPGLHEFTDEQMFFLSHAQTTCGPLPESTAEFDEFMERKRLDYLYYDPFFYEAFGCPINYNKTCLPWKHE